MTEGYIPKKVKFSAKKPQRPLYVITANKGTINVSEVRAEFENLGADVIIIPFSPNSAHSPFVQKFQ